MSIIFRLTDKKSVVEICMVNADENNIKYF